MSRPKFYVRSLLLAVLTVSLLLGVNRLLRRSVSREEAIRLATQYATVHAGAFRPETCQVRASIAGLNRGFWLVSYKRQGVLSALVRVNRRTGHCRFVPADGWSTESLD